METPSSGEGRVASYVASLDDQELKALYEAVLLDNHEVVSEFLAGANVFGCECSAESFKASLAELSAEGVFDHLDLSQAALDTISGGAANPTADLKKVRTKRDKEGFSLVEILIAGSTLAFVSASVARLSVSSLNTSSNQSQRVVIESVINDDMAMIQQADSSLTWDHIQSAGQELNSCSSPANFFRDVVSDGLDVTNQGVTTTRVSPVAEPTLPQGITGELTRTISEGDSDNIILVTYEFEGPEANVESERRVMEIYPVFAESCFLVSASINKNQGGQSSGAEGCRQGGGVVAEGSWGDRNGPPEGKGGGASLGGDANQVEGVGQGAGGPGDGEGPGRGAGQGLGPQDCPSSSKGVPQASIDLEHTHSWTHVHGNDPSARRVEHGHNFSHSHANTADDNHTHSDDVYLNLSDYDPKHNDGTHP